MSKQTTFATNMACRARCAHICCLRVYGFIENCPLWSLCRVVCAVPCVLLLLERGLTSCVGMRRQYRCTCVFSTRNLSIYHSIQHVLSRLAIHNPQPLCPHSPEYPTRVSRVKFRNGLLYFNACTTGVTAHSLPYVYYEPSIYNTRTDLQTR